MILEMLTEAVRNLNWELVTLSRYQYRRRRPTRLQHRPWQERTFAYELYHQLRILWDKYPKLQKKFVIQAEVRKAYQHIPDFDRMPDFIFISLAPTKILLLSRSSSPPEELSRFVRIL